MFRTRRWAMVALAAGFALGWALALSSPLGWLAQSEPDTVRRATAPAEPKHHEARVVFSASFSDGQAASNAADARKRVPDDQIPDKHRTKVYRDSHEHGDLSQLPKRRAPGGPEWTNSVAICACMFQENLTDVREWLLYHQWLGVEHVYLTENSSPPPADLQPQIQDFIDSGFLTFRAVARPEFQVMFYRDCMEQHRHKHNWMAFIDLDEFIVLRKKGETLQTYLDKFKNEPALVVHWILVGPSHRQRRAREGGALRHYRECNKHPNAVFKSITNTWFLANTCGSPHTFEHRNNKRAMNEHGRRVPPRYPPPPACLDGTVPDPALDINCRPVPDVQIPGGASVKDIAVFHYLTKSKEDFEAKIERGGGGNTHRTWSHFNTAQRMSGGGGICDEPAKLAERCCNPRDYVLRVDEPQQELEVSDVDDDNEEDGDADENDSTH